MIAKQKDLLDSATGYQYVKPVYISKLVEKLNNFADVGKLIGVTGTTVGKALKENRVTMVTETAARGIWKERYENRNYVLIQIGDEHIPYIKSMVVGQGGTATDITI